MNISYSKTTNGFYPDFLMESYKANGTLPPDLIEISEYQYKELIDGQIKGKRIGPDENGNPCLFEREADPQVAISKAKIAKDDLIRKASNLIDAFSDLIESGKSDEIHEAYFASLKEFRMKMLTVDLSDRSSWPEFPEID